jgi:hypothetical protein
MQGNPSLDVDPADAGNDDAGKNRAAVDLEMENVLP